MRILSTFLFLCCTLSLSAQRIEQTLTQGWTFHRGDAAGAEAADYDDSQWQRVSIPHDWAIFGPFSRDNDLQVVAVTQNGETEATEHTGRTGGLPYVGVGWYRRDFTVDAATPGSTRRAVLVFDGAMSQAHVFVNGREVILSLIHI